MCEDIQKKKKKKEGKMRRKFFLFWSEVHELTYMQSGSEN